MLYFLIFSPLRKPHFVDEEEEEQNRLPTVTQSELESEPRFGSSLVSKGWILEFLASIKVRPVRNVAKGPVLLVILY